MKKQIFSIFLTLILIFILKNTCNAANANISCADSVTVGDTINISVTGSAVQWNLELKVNGQVIAKNSEVDNIDGNKNINFSGKYTPTNVGTLNVTLTGTITEMSDGSTTRNFSPKTITVRAKDTSSSDSSNLGNNTTDDNTTVSKSTEAKLSNLEINPNDFTGFRKNIYKYTHEVPNSVSEITVKATPVKGATVTSGTGKVALKEGNNEIKVNVMAEDGKTTQTYTLTIKRRTADEENAQTQEDADASLKSLGIKPEKYDFSGFKKDKTQYSVQVPEDVEEVEVYAEATSSKAKITGTGKTQLKNGRNTIVVQVTAENGTTQTYTIEATRGDAEATATTSSKNEFGLSSLEIDGLTLNPSFETGTYEYKVDLNKDINFLDIKTIANDDDTTVEIYGNEGLSLGENTITILVRNEKENKTATYQIIVNKSLSEEEKMSWLKPSTWGREEVIKIIIIAVLIILIVIAIILKVKIAKEKNEEEDLEFPGGEELDKALAEHQVLSETAEMQINSELENMKNREKENNEDESGFDGTNYIEDIARSKKYKVDYQNDSFNNDSSKRKGKHF